MNALLERVKAAGRGLGLFLSIGGGILALVLSGCRGTGAAEPPSLTVAAASDLYFAFTEIGRVFQERTGIRVTFSFGSTGQLAQQIEQGAPFDVFAAADEAYIERLMAQGLVLPESRRLYARGRLALVVNRRSGLRVARIADLADPAIGPIAIANPDHAPYGRAARQALARAGLWERVAPRIVMGENVRQALRFVQTGDAPVGIVALAIAEVPEVSYTLIPAELHDPINQAMVVIRASARRQEALRFVQFVAGVEGQSIMRRYGFQSPEGF